MTNYLIMGYSRNDRFDEQFCSLIKAEASAIKHFEPKYSELSFLGVKFQSSDVKKT